MLFAAYVEYSPALHFVLINYFILSTSCLRIILFPIIRLSKMKVLADEFSLGDISLCLTTLVDVAQVHFLSLDHSWLNQARAGVNQIRYFINPTCGNDKTQYHALAKSVCSYK